jgi:hypothetical protein
MFLKERRGKRCFRIEAGKTIDKPTKRTTIDTEGPASWGSPERARRTHLSRPVAKGGHMHPNVARLTTPEECEQFAINVAEKYPDLALEAKRRAVELRAQQAGVKTDVEREALEAVYAYEAVLSEQKGKRIRASRTWQMIKRHGIIGAMERAVDRDDDPSGYKALVAMGMEDLSFEAVVLRHPSVFSPEAIAHCKKRLADYKVI